MLIKLDKTLANASEVTENLPSSVAESDIYAIREFLKGCLRSHYNSVEHGNEFSLRDFVGKSNRDWTETAPNVLHDAYLHEINDEEVAYREAAKAAGRILRKLIIDSERLYLNTRYFNSRHFYREVD